MILEIPRRISWPSHCIALHCLWQNATVRLNLCLVCVFFSFFFQFLPKPNIPCAVHSESAQSRTNQLAQFNQKKSAPKLMYFAMHFSKINCKNVATNRQQTNKNYCFISNLYFSMSAGGRGESGKTDHNGDERFRNSVVIFSNLFLGWISVFRSKWLVEKAEKNTPAVAKTVFILR